MMSDKKNPCFLLLEIINRFLTLVMMILALVVGFMFVDCNKDMSTWLLVYGFMAPIMFILIIVIFCCALPSIFLAMKERSDEDVIISLLPCIICTIIVGLGIIIFNIAWTIYGAVLFFPVASGPYTICNDDKDGKVLVISGTIIVAFEIIFCFREYYNILGAAYAWSREQQNN